MGVILVSGLINIETTVQVDGFPIVYSPVRYPFFGVNSDVSGVGYNVAKALVTLGSRVRFLSLIGSDLAGKSVYDRLAEDRIPAEYVLAALDHTPQSVILYDPEGRRQINVDLKDVQERPYPGVHFEQAAQDCALAALCNVNFSRPFLRAMQERGVPVATDVHAISDLDDGYNRDFMAAAQILFMSDEKLPCTAEEWVRRLWNRYGAEMVVVGLGAQGALLGLRRDNAVEHFPTVATRPVINSIGAGDALFSCFVHCYHRSGDPYDALRRAVVFASYKIGAASAADGFLSEAELDEWCRTVAGRG
jgi:ribokinase